MRVLGASVKSGLLYLAAVDESEDDAAIGLPADVCSARIRPNTGLDPAARLGDLYDRVTQELRAASPDYVAILATRKNSQWLYTHAVERISVIATLHLACHHLQIPCSEIKTEPVGRAVNTRADKLETVDPSKFGYASPPVYWAAGLSEAHAVTAVPLTKANGYA